MPPKQQKVPISPDDKTFFQGFYEEYKSFLYYVASQYAQSDADREDIVQDALLRLMYNLDNIRNLNKYKAAKYISLTVRSSCLDILKKRRNSQEVPLDESIIETLLEHDPVQGRDYPDARLEILQLKESLSAREWRILEGKYLMGYDQDELSRLVGVSPDSVRMTLCRARSKARSILLAEKEKEEDHHG